MLDLVLLYMASMHFTWNSFAQWMKKNKKQKKQTKQKQNPLSLAKECWRPIVLLEFRQERPCQPACWLYRTLLHVSSDKMTKKYANMPTSFGIFYRISCQSDFFWQLVLCRHYISPISLGSDRLAIHVVSIFYSTITVQKSLKTYYTVYAVRKNLQMWIFTIFSSKECTLKYLHIFIFIPFWRNDFTHMPIIFKYLGPTHLFLFIPFCRNILFKYLHILFIVIPFAAILRDFTLYFFRLFNIFSLFFFQ